MAAAELFKESPDGHADLMGTCYSAGNNKKAPESSSFPSARSPKAEARHTPASAQPAPRTSSTGKARRTQISCLDSSHQALGRSTSTGKDCRSSLASASAKNAGSAHTSCKRAQTSVARSLSFEDHARTRSKDSPQTRELSTAEDCHTNASSTSNAIDAHHVLQNNHLNDGKKEMHQTHTHSDVSDMGARSSGFVAGTSKTIPIHTDRDHTVPGISSPHSSDCLTSYRSKQDDEPAALLRVPEMGPLPGMHNMRSLSLKSGVGPYEVLTPRKSIENLQGSTPQNAGSRLVKKSGSFPPLGRKDQGAKVLCKNCKSSNLDSVCFIANDGKIAAANTGPATKCHFHHCNSPKCAANPNYDPESFMPCKKVLPKKQPVRSESVRTKSRNNVSHKKNETIVCASLGDNVVDLPQCTSEDHIDAEKNVCHENLVLNQDSKESSNEQPSNFMQGVDTQEVCSENGPDIVTAPPQSSCDANQDMGQSSFIVHEGVQRAHAKAYQEDNELSYSDDGADTLTTAKSATKGAFDDLSNTEFAQANAAKTSQARKSSMERMRQKYLDTLKEQEAETVRLKKQEMHARKQAGEWMLDCAMGEILHRLAPDGEAGVKVLVEAFETIMQHSDSEAQHEEHVVCDGISLEDASKPLHL